MEIFNNFFTIFKRKPRSLFIDDKLDNANTQTSMLERIKGIWTNHTKKIILIGAFSALIGLKFVLDKKNANLQAINDRCSEEMTILKEDLLLQNKAILKKENFINCEKSIKDLWIESWDNWCRHLGKVTMGERDSMCEYYRAKVTGYNSIRAIERSLGINLTEKEKCWAIAANKGSDHRRNFKKCMGIKY